MVNINLNIDGKDLDSKERLEQILSFIQNLNEDRFDSFEGMDNELNEEELKRKKEIMFKNFKKYPTAASTQLGKAILDKKVFRVNELREEFDYINWGTIRAYIGSMKKEGLLKEISRGKYALL